MQPVTTRRHEAATEPQVACIRLIGGSSDDAVWVLEEGVGGTFLTIGASPESEWQIRAAGVPPQAVSVLLIGGTVYVRSGPERAVRMNGNLLSQDWLQVDADARLDIGMASLEIKLGKDALLPSLRDLRTPIAPERERRPKRARQHAPLQAHDSAREQDSWAERSGMRRSYVPEPRAAHSHRAPSERSAHRSAAGRAWLCILSAAALFGGYALWVTWLD